MHSTQYCLGGAAFVVYNSERYAAIIQLRKCKAWYHMQNVCHAFIMPSGIWYTFTISIEVHMYVHFQQIFNIIIIRVIIVS